MKHESQYSQKLNVVWTHAAVQELTREISYEHFKWNQEQSDERVVKQDRDVEQTLDSSQHNRHTAVGIIKH